MATFYVRPATDIAVNGNGTAFAEAASAGGVGAWRGLASVSWASIAAGDTLYVCGLHRGTWETGRDGTSGNIVTIRGDYEFSPGEIRASDLVTGAWSLHGAGAGSTYVAPHTLARASVSVVFCDYTTPLVLGSGANTLSAGQFFWDDTNDLLYVRLAGDSNPAEHQVEICNNLFGMRLGRPYTRLQGLHVAHGDWSTVGGIVVDKYNAIINGCEVFDCEVGPCGSSGIYINEPGVIVQGCHIHHCWNGKAYSSGGLGYGVVASGVAADALNNSADAIIRRNLFEYNNRGIVTMRAPGWKIYHNFVLNSLVNGIDCRTGVSTGYVDVYNNYILHHPSESSGHGLVAQAAGHYTRFKNNIVVCDFAGANVENIAIDDSHHVEEDNNLLINTADGGYIALLGYDGIIDPQAKYTTMAEYQAAMDALKSNATLVWTSNGTLGNAAGANDVTDTSANLDGDEKPLATSAAIGAGIDVGLTTDADGNAVPGALGYDIGPYSYMPGWTPFDESMPPLTIAPTCPGKLKQVQEWSKVASAREIGQL